MTQIQFAATMVLLLSMGVTALLFAQFIKALGRCETVEPQVLEDLSQLLLSGGGGIRAQNRGLLYFLRGEYASVASPVATKAGDTALAAWCVTVFFALVLVLAMANGA